MWKACLNILPTKHQLRLRRIRRDEKCELCGSYKTSGHALWGCTVAGEVWGNTRLKLPYLESMPRDFIDIVWEIKIKKPELEWELFVITAWRLWCNRNLVRHGGRCKEAALIAQEATAYAKEVRQTNKV